MELLVLQHSSPGVRKVLKLDIPEVHARCLIAVICICSATLYWMHRIESAHSLARPQKESMWQCQQPSVRGQVSRGEGCAALHTEGLCREPRGHAVPGQQMGLWLLFPGLSYLTTSSLREQLFRSLHWDATRTAIFLLLCTLYIV